MFGYAHVRNGSNSEVGSHNLHVRFTPGSDRTADIAGGPIRATTGLMHRSKQHRYSITSSARSSSDDGTFIRPRICSVHASVEIEFPNGLSHTCQRQ
jgi:hypothetical protein